uniref:Uncharacterized protein n=1 Tax=Solanum tuberosum TaxID=4113 RepID=M1DSV9_SOLTU
MMRGRPAQPSFMVKTLIFGSWSTDPGPRTVVRPMVHWSNRGSGPREWSWCGQPQTTPMTTVRGWGQWSKAPISKFLTTIDDRDGRTVVLTTDDCLDMNYQVDPPKLEVMVLTLASRTTLFCVGDNGDHVIAHIVSMSCVAKDHSAQLVGIADALGDLPFGLLHRLSTVAFNIFVFWIIGRYSTALQNCSAKPTAPFHRRLDPFL